LDKSLSTEDDGAGILVLDKKIVPNSKKNAERHKAIKVKRFISFLFLPKDPFWPNLINPAYPLEKFLFSGT
jgi:hypothetical protein